MPSSDQPAIGQCIRRERHRPAIITVICIVVALGLLALILLAFSSAGKVVGSWYPPYLVFSGMLGFAAVVGLWQMRRWGIWLYVLSIVINQAVLFYIGSWTFTSLLFPALIISVASSFYNDFE